MDKQHIKQKIVAETTALMPLKVDNEDVVKRTFRTIRDQVAELYGSVSEENEIYTKAYNLIQTAMDTEYSQFSDSVIHDEKEQALIQLKHKAAEVCQILNAQ